MVQKFVDGIVYATFNDKVIIDLDAARECVEQRKKLTDFNSAAILIDAKNIKNLTKEARQYLGSEEGYRLLSAAAVISESHVSNFIANFFIKVNLSQASVPVKLFSKKSKAIEWLNKYR